MDKKSAKNKNKNKGAEVKGDSIAYRLKCAKTANGLSHFVMYGDVDQKKTLL